MIKIVSATAFLFLLGAAAVAQQAPGTFGTVTQQEMELTVYEKDPEAEALVLFDVGEAYFFDTETGYDIRFTRTRRIKVLSRAGIDFAEVSIPYYVDGYGKTETVASIEAYSYSLENGGVVKRSLTPDKIYEEKISDRIRSKKFAIPNVKEGSVIEYRYVLETPFHFNLPDWEFQDRIPTLYSQYTAKMIPFYEYVFLAQGMNKFDFQESKLDPKKRVWGSVAKAYGTNVGRGFEFQDMVHTYVMKNMPAFRDEAYITSPRDYVAKIDFQYAKFNHPVRGSESIISTWPELTKDLLKHDDFGKYTKSAARLAKDILENELQLGQQSDQEKSQRIIEWVKANFKWDGYYARYASKSPKDFLKQKSGNTADINLFMLGMLQEAGLSAQAVLLSTRNHGKIKSDYPFLHFFNYVVVLVEANGRPFLADGAEYLLAYDRIPPRCLNDRGLVIREGAPLWVDLSSPLQSVDTKTISITPNPQTLKATATVTIQATEFDALSYRNRYKNDSARIREALLERGFTDISRVRTYNFEKLASPYMIAYEGETEIEQLDDKLIISPFLHFPLQKNLLTQKTRTYPIDFTYSSKESFSSRITIPEGYTVVSLPEKLEIDSELAHISLSYALSKESVQATATYHFKKSLYGVAEYEKIKQYMDHIVRKFNQQVVLQAL